MKQKIGVLLWLIFQAWNISAQMNELQFRSYTNEQGLSQNSVYSITQSAEGFIWAGTINGLNRFDGKKFRTFYPTLPDSSSTSSVVYHIFIDKDHHFFVGTAEELFLFDPIYGKFHIAKDTLDGLQLPEKIGVSQIIDDHLNRIWISTLAHGLFCYDQRNKKMIPVLQDESEKIKVTGMCKTSSGQVLVTTETKVFRSNSSGLENLNIDFTSITEHPSIRCVAMLGNQIALGLYDIGLVLCNKTNTEISFSIKKDIGVPYPDDLVHLESEGDSVLWLASRSKGILKVDFPDHQWTKASINTRLSGLKSNFVLMVFQDKQNNTWLGLSGGGLAVLPANKKSFDLIRPAILSNQPDADNMVFGITEYDAATIYMGSLNYGLKEYLPQQNKINYYFDNNLPTEASNIYDILLDKNQLWLATWAGLISFDISKKIFQNWTIDNSDAQRLYSVFAINDDQLLLGGENGLLVFDKISKKYSAPLDKDTVLENVVLETRHIERLDDDHVLLATTDRNLVQYNYTTGVFTFFPELEKLSTACRHFFIDGKEIFLATENGVLQIDKKYFSIKKHYTSVDGLSNNFCYAILKDQFNQVWISSNGGLSKINLTNHQIKNFGLADGLQDLEFNTASCIQTQNGQLIFGGINGFNTFNPRFTSKDIAPEPPQLIDIKIMNETFQHKKIHSYLKNITLPYNQNFLSIEFSSPSEIKKDAVKYQYRMEGVNDEWVDNGRRNYANFTNLNAGEYNFQVRSSFGNKLLSPVNKQFSIKIEPVFYNTLWFKSLLALVSFAAIYFFYRNRMNRLKEKVEIERKMERLENMALRSQMNPHFLFNTLNSIKHYAVFKSKNETSEFIADFSNLMRMILENSRHNFISLSEEMELIKLYIGIEQRRLKDNFQFQLNCDKDISLFEKQIPPMLIQPFVENSIWHGLMHKEGDKKLIINFFAKENGFDCEIIDNGIGRKTHATIKKKRKKKSLAIEIAKDRLNLLTQDSNQPNEIEIIDLYNDNNVPTGTKVVLRLRD